GSNGSVIEQCLHDAGVINIRSFEGVGAAELARFPLLALPNAFALERLAVAMPARLEAMGYFDDVDAPKIGVLTIDQPAWRAATDDALVPALEAAGYSVQDVAYVRSAEYTEDAGQSSAEIQSAVVQFNSQGIDHVIFFEGLVSYLFINSAAGQGYNPRYAFTSMDSPAAIASVSETSQFEDSVSIGWQPSADVNGAQRDEIANSRAERCIDIVGDEFPLASAVAGCDSTLFLMDALRAGPTPVSTSSYLQGVAALGNSFHSSKSYGTFFSSKRHDGAAQVRDVKWNVSCTCFEYTSGLISVG
ncbi:MAG: hypothetical protein ACI867_001852, partial [Glaciecola sp.]